MLNAIFASTIPGRKRTGRSGPLWTVARAAVAVVPVVVLFALIRRRLVGGLTAGSVSKGDGLFTRLLALRSWMGDWASCSRRSSR
jgi:hypothetical protein